jgi:LysM repeat protein
MTKKSNFKNRLLIPLILAILLTVLAVQPACAQDAGSLIGEVNALRASYGLAAYTTDSTLSSLAQAQSVYQASINRITHDRADGSGIPARSENVCGGLNMSASTCVKTIWTDPIHLYTLIGLDSGTVGAGYALSSDNNAYYTLLVNSSGSDTRLELAASPTQVAIVAANQNAADSFIDVLAAPVSPGTIATNTAEPDGSIYHIVQPNETMWTIAVTYGTTVEQLQAFNNRTGDDVNVVAGQRLLIRYGGTPVADTLTPTLTRPPATNTPGPTSTMTQTVPPLPTRTPTITPTPTPGPLIPHIGFFDKPQARILGLVLVIVCGVGLVLTSFFGFYKK